MAAVSPALTFVWTLNGSWLLNHVTSKRVPVCGGTLRGIVGVRRGAPLAVLDTIEGVVEVRTATECSVVEDLARPPAAAVGTAAGWLLLDRGPPGGVTLSFWPMSPGYPAVHSQPIQRSFPLPQSDSADATWFYLAPAGTGVILGSHRWPFQWLQLSQSGLPDSSRIQANYALRPEFAPTQDPERITAFWYALPPLDLGAGYLQVVRDLVTGRRVLTLFNNLGRVVRTREVAYAFAGFASEPRYNRLFGVRIVGDRPELVVYEWRWQGSDAAEGTKH